MLLANAHPVLYDAITDDAGAGEDGSRGTAQPVNARPRR